jgi:hypothetical protein
VRTLVILVVLAIAPAAAAERLVVPAGSRVTIETPGKPVVVVLVGAEHLFIDRELAEAVTAEAALAEELERRLLQCQGDVEKAAKKNQPAPGWYTAVKYVGVGGALVGAFFLGLTLGP